MSFIDFLIKIKVEYLVDIPLKDMKPCDEKFYIIFRLPNKDEIKTKRIQDTYHPVFEETLIAKNKINPSNFEDIEVFLY